MFESIRVLKGIWSSIPLGEGGVYACYNRWLPLISTFSPFLPPSSPPPFLPPSTKQEVPLSWEGAREEEGVWVKM